MAKDFDYDTCLGFKRRISELSEIKCNQPTLLEHQHSNSLSPEQQPSEIVSFAKEESETKNGLLKKAKCHESESKVVQKKQETEEEKLGYDEDEDGVVGESDCRLVPEKGKELKDCEFVEAKKSSCSRLSVKEVQKHSKATSCVTFDENESESFLKTKEEVCLVQPALESIADAIIHVSKFTNFQRKREIMGDASKIKKEFDNSLWVVVGKFGTVEIPVTDGNGRVCEGMHKMAESSLKRNGETTKRSLKIEVIDETALIKTTSVCKVGHGIGKEKGFVGFAKHSGRNVQNNVMKQERDGKKKKWPQRRGKFAKKMSGTNGNDKVLIHTAEVQNCQEKKGDEAKRAYPREEMEALKFVNLEAQRKMWIEVYRGLAPTVAREYDGLINCNHQKCNRFNSDPRQQFGKKEMTSGVLGVVAAAKGRGNHLKIFVH